MNVQYSEQVKQSPALYRQLQEISAQFDDAFTRSAATATVTWDRELDAEGQPRVALRISGEGDAASVSFTREELTDARHVRSSLYHVWSNFLQQRSDRMIDAMMANRE